jgi:hypothetical protein
MNHISTDIAYKIGQAQRDITTQYINRALAEYNYIVSNFTGEINSQLDNILSDPFKPYVKIPVKDDCNDKIFTQRLQEEYSRTFQHSLHIDNGCYYILLQSPHFSTRDERPKTVSVLKGVKDTPEESFVFSDKEKKEYEEKMGKHEVIEKRLGYENEKNLSLLLLRQRRNSKLYLPTFSARKTEQTAGVHTMPGDYPASKIELSLTERETSVSQSEDHH